MKLIFSHSVNDILSQILPGRHFETYKSVESLQFFITLIKPLNDYDYAIIDDVEALTMT